MEEKEIKELMKKKFKMRRKRNGESGYEWDKDGWRERRVGVDMGMECEMDFIKGYFGKLL